MIGVFAQVISLIKLSILVDKKSSVVLLIFLCGICQVGWDQRSRRALRSLREYRCVRSYLELGVGNEVVSWGFKIVWI